jgi:hypothetical protein
VEIRDSLEALVAAFNRGSLDVPDGLFTPRTTFSLNGRSYESMLGGSSDDPLIRLLARGAGGYRTAAKALQYALQQPMLAIQSLVDADVSGVAVASLRIAGTLRDSGEPFTGHGALRLSYSGGKLISIDAECSSDDLARIAAARGR